jgi:hypothetical protein
MNISINRIRNIARPISLLVLALLLIWFILPTESQYSSSTFSLYKPNTEQVLVHFDLTKQSTSNPISKDLHFVLQATLLMQSLGQSPSLIKLFLNVNSFVRNTFYVHTTINAP